MTIFMRRSGGDDLIGQLAALTGHIEREPEPLLVRVAGAQAALAACGANALARRVVGEIETDLVVHLFVGREALDLAPLLEKLELPGAALRQHEATARRNLERSRSVSVVVRLGQEAQRDLRERRDRGELSRDGRSH